MTAGSSATAAQSCAAQLPPITLEPVTPVMTDAAAFQAIVDRVELEIAARISRGTSRISRALEMTYGVHRGPHGQGQF
jgi:hypothetical protein